MHGRWKRPADARGASAGRLVGLGIVVALHVGVVYALVTGLAQRTVEIVRAPIEARILPPDRPPPPVAPPPPQPQLAPPPPLFVPPPEVHIAPRPRPKTAVIHVTPVKPPEPAPPVVAPPVAVPPVAAPPPRAPVRVQPRLDLTRSHEPAYPALSRRLGEQGSLIVQALVGEDGRASDVKLIESSGYPRLDEAALAGIRGDYRFVPGAVDGKPTPQWFTFRFVWKIK